ncbi:tyrosine--tRNA ligase [Rufibacter glacialis]|uniref:Tyrosine--tRNA ligase n=1 Tax=Rufibacter glacialis TaxID=1259555 RepID=A0A5M8QFH2_9BACT|nr:tyrosine--tRNA ligase [Rufibacter glacialis]KAA6434749.1 tyrosine--tRNA ligase [Rufibacter glacialis]GGK72120.1 tyrosine--tRNA ligase [Rufibacter glacialis]
METINRLKENVEIILPQDGLEQKLEQAKNENRSLVIKLGFDPTAPDLHLGHAVVLKKMKQFQDFGHQIVILVGSFTATIGDPTGKNKSRKPLSIEEVQHNAETYISQLSKVIDVSKAKIVFNSEWLDKLSSSELIQLLSKVTVAQLMHRNDFNKRFTENTPISMHELLYPILQGFDSVKLNCDVEMGGTDQLFNCTMGRQLQETFNLSPQIVMCMPLLKGLDGKEKMSKSLNNIIGLTDEPTEMFGKTMSIPDNLILEYLDLATDFSPEEKQVVKERLSTGENPMDIKKAIAKNIISQYHSKEDADKAERFFQNQFQNKKFDEKAFTPVAIESLEAQNTALALINLCQKLKADMTKSALKRLIEGGGVQVNNDKVMDSFLDIELVAGTKIRIGKRDFYELL